MCREKAGGIAQVGNSKRGSQEPVRVTTHLNKKNSLIQFSLMIMHDESVMKLKQSVTIPRLLISHAQQLEILVTGLNRKKLLFSLRTEPRFSTLKETLTLLSHLTCTHKLVQIKYNLYTADNLTSKPKNI